MTQSRLEQVNLLDLAPVRVAAWQERDERVIVERPRPELRGWRGWWQRVSYRMSARRIRLDAVGTFAWKRLDGKPTVGEVAEALRVEFGTAAEPAEDRLGKFVRQLRREGLLALPGWDDVGEPPPDALGPDS